MARRKKKLNIGFSIFTAIIFTIAGILLGMAGKIYIFTDDSYVIPEPAGSNSSMAASSLDVEVIKDEDLSIHFLELGNKYTGDSTFIRVGDVEILIDAGSRANSVKTIYDYISDYISSDGVLDYVIVTHAHQDHYAGFATNDNTESLFDKLNVGKVIKFTNTNQKSTAKLYSNFVRELEETKTENGTIVVTAEECYNNASEEAQRIFSLGNDVELEILTHKYNKAGASAHSENDYSVCCLINQGSGESKRSYLFTGDLEADGEESLVEENTLPKVELYKAGHHGSKTSSSTKLLSVIQPKIVCVCCCAGSSEYTSKNENQFPTQQFIDRIAPYTDAIYVTTLCVDYEKGTFQSMNGNIVITASAESETEVYCANSTDKLKDSAWFQSNRTLPEAWAS